MQIFIVSRHPIPEFEKPDADLLVDDIIDLFQDSKTCAINDRHVALSKRQLGDAKFVYSLSIERIEK